MANSFEAPSSYLGTVAHPLAEILDGFYCESSDCEKSVADWSQMQQAERLGLLNPVKEFSSLGSDTIPTAHLSRADFRMIDGSDLGSLSNSADGDSSFSLSCQFYWSGSHNNGLQSDEKLDFPCVDQLQHGCRLFSPALTQNPTGYILGAGVSRGFPCVPLRSHELASINPGIERLIQFGLLQIGNGYAIG